MSNLHIRNVEEGLLRRAKAHAALNGVTLRDYVVGLIEEDLGEKTKPKPTRGKAPRK